MQRGRPHEAGNIPEKQHKGSSIWPKENRQTKESVWKNTDIWKRTQEADIRTEEENTKGKGNKTDGCIYGQKVGYSKQQKESADAEKKREPRELEQGGMQVVASESQQSACMRANYGSGLRTTGKENRTKNNKSSQWSQNHGNLSTPLVLWNAL